MGKVSVDDLVRALEDPQWARAQGWRYTLLFGDTRCAATILNGDRCRRSTFTALISNAGLVPLCETHRHKLRRGKVVMWRS